MNEKIKKLLKSSNINDVRIGLSLLPKTPENFREINGMTNNIQGYRGLIYWRYRNKYVLVCVGIYTRTFQAYIPIYAEIY